MTVFPRLVSSLIVLAALALALALGLGFLGALHPSLDSFAHFRVHLGVILGLTGLVLLAICCFKSGAAALLTSLLAIATVSGSVPVLGMSYGTLHPRDQEVATYSILHLNLLYNNQNPERVLSLIGRLNPDVISLNEVSPMWIDKLALVKATYRFQTICFKKGSRSGVAIVSRRPFVEGTVPFCDNAGNLAIAQISFGGQIADFAALHLDWPWPFPQSWEIGTLTPLLARLGDTAILTGDLNAVPWSASARRVAQAGGLTLMPSPGSTWLPKGLPASLFFAGLPIDNIYAKGDIFLQSVESLAPVGSDHLPLLATFSFKPAPDRGRPSTDIVSLSF